MVDNIPDKIKTISSFVFLFIIVLTSGLIWCITTFTIAIWLSLCSGFISCRRIVMRYI